jgi:hypothetical protein
MPPPDPTTIVYCVSCRKPRNGKGWFGPGCMCDLPKSGSTVDRAHRIGSFTPPAGSRP